MNKKELNIQKHTFEPIYNKNSKILILGTFPSIKSRENNFYYGHPQNRFWKVISYLTNYPLPKSIEEKKLLLLENKIAIWDVIKSCEIIGSSDSSIKNVIPNEIDKLIQNSEIKKIYANGKKAEELYKKNIYPKTKIEINVLPSTSPANASYSFEKLIEHWKCILNINK